MDTLKVHVGYKDKDKRVLVAVVVSGGALMACRSSCQVWK